MHVLLIPTDAPRVALGAPVWTAVVEGDHTVSGIGATPTDAAHDLEEAMLSSHAMAERHGWLPLPRGTPITRITTVATPPSREQLAALLATPCRPGMRSSVSTA